MTPTIRWPSLGAVVAVTLSSAATAQLDHSASLHPVPAAASNAGIYHVSTGTWTRHASVAGLGPDIVYNNTCPSGYFSSLSGDTFVDEGQIPNPSTPATLSTQPGCAASYTINGFQITYCTDQPGYQTTINFYNDHLFCTSVIGVSPVASFALSGLPGETTSGIGCWILTVDTSGSAAFAITSANRFGWSMSSTTPGNASGPQIAGEPAVCLGYDGTSFDPTINLAEAGTGMFTQNQFFIEGGPTSAGCYYFGGTPFASFHLELYSDSCATDGGGISSFCAGGVSTTPCPCGNNPPASADTGCLNSGGVGARLTATGSPRIATDTISFSGVQMPATSSCLYMQGVGRLNNSNGIVFGDGLRCVQAPIVRLGTRVNVAGASTFPAAGTSVSALGGVTEPGSRTYQIWYRNNASFCTSAPFNLSNGVEIVWGP